MTFSNTVTKDLLYIIYTVALKYRHVAVSGIVRFYLPNFCVVAAPTSTRALPHVIPTSTRALPRIVPTSTVASSHATSAIIYSDIILTTPIGE